MIDSILIPVLTVHVDGVAVPGTRGDIPNTPYAYDAEGETIEAVGAAIAALDATPDAVVTLIVSYMREGSQ